MNYRKTKKMLRISFLTMLAVALLAGPSLAVDLAAVEAVWTTPDTAAPVAMWGYIADTGACPGAPVPWDVGPEINVLFDKSISDIFCTEDVVVLAEIVAYNI